MRAAIYARYSTDLQREASIEDRVRICRKRIEQEGWESAATYSDAASSGASRLRPGYQKLLEDARGGQFDIVVAEALDRLSRDQEDVAALYKHLSFAGVRLLTLAEGEISELHVGLKGTMNALFLKDLAAKTHRGIEGRVRQGEGVPGPRGRPWGDTTIRGHALRGTGVLHNELYVGRLVWNRQRYVKDPGGTGRRLARLNPASGWLITDVPDLRIVDQDLWQQVQARLTHIRQSPMVANSRATEFWTRRRARHLLTGRAFCGCCGGTLSAVGKDYLACRSARQGMCTNTRSFRRPLLESLILDGLKSRLMAPELVKEFITEFHREVKMRSPTACARPASEASWRNLKRANRNWRYLSTAARPPSLACTPTWLNSIARGSLSAPGTRDAHRGAGDPARPDRAHRPARG
jgi:site-specific DNA recombinase